MVTQTVNKSHTTAWYVRNGNLILPLTHHFHINGKVLVQRQDILPSKLETQFVGKPLSLLCGLLLTRNLFFVG